MKRVFIDSEGDGAKRLRSQSAPPGAENETTDRIKLSPSWSESRSETESNDDESSDPEEIEENELVLSDVHLHPDNGDPSSPALRLTAFQPKNSNGDATNYESVTLQHRMGTPLPYVGLQVWRGALLLADLVLSKPEEFRESVILELGAGLGFVSILAAKTHSNVVFATDILVETTAALHDESSSPLPPTCVLDLLSKNIARNQQTDRVFPRICDFFDDDCLLFCPSISDLPEPQSSTSTFAWKNEDIETIRSAKKLVILAADIIYDAKVTYAFVARLPALLENLNEHAVMYLALEKRINFTMEERAEVAPAYDYLLETVRAFQMADWGREEDVLDLKLKRLEVGDLPQWFDYERGKYLELFEISFHRPVK
ncbi:hypothetical protein BJ742DRAFT_855597, partial [Cladochytrium replicatum]